MTYVDGFILPLPKGKEDEYRTQAEKFARKAEAQGALGTIEALGDNLEHGHTTDFFRAVQATDDEVVLFSWVEWPDKATRDAGMKKVMEDPRMKPENNPMPFDGKRLIYGGFQPVVTLGG